jgi:chromosome segregation ATPase
MEEKQPQSIVKFLLGESDFENKWYGVRENGIAPYWWRTELRKEVDSLTSQLSSALESYNRECKRKHELQAEVDKQKTQLEESTLLYQNLVSNIQSQKEEIELYREALTEAKSVLEWHLDKSGPNNTNDQSDFFNMTANVATQIDSALSKHQPIKKDENL